MSAPVQEVYLTGPTAVGKSAVALLLAETLGGEIISVDSMQVYRGLDLGTAKPSPAERARVPHHLVDLLSLEESFTAADFIRHVRAVLPGIRQRGRVPIFCGGTGLYLKAWLAGLGTTPAPNPALRAELEAAPVEDLLAELRAADPETYARLDRANPRRVVRAVEILRLSGRPPSALRADWRSAPGTAAAAPVVFGLRREAEDLRRRIANRVEAMFAAGLVEETRRLLERGLAANRTALQAIGYRQVVEYLQGRRSLEETRQLVRQKTWQYARRQLTWCRHQLPMLWLDLVPDEPPEETARRILARLREGQTRPPPAPSPGLTPDSGSGAPG